MADESKSTQAAAKDDPVAAELKKVVDIYQQRLEKLETMQKSGQVLVAAALAREYGFTDIDGTQPRP